MPAPLTVRDYLRLFFRRKYAFLLPILCSVALILPMWKIVPEKYRSSALVKRKDLSLTSIAGNAMNAQENAPIAVETMRAEILTWTNLDRVVKQLKLDVDLKTAAEWQNEYEMLKKAITIRTAAEGRGVDLIEIAVMDKDASASQKIANAIADNYVEESQRNSRTETLQAIDYFKSQCDENLAIIRNTNLELDKYTKEHWTDLPAVKLEILNTLGHLKTTKSEHLLLQSAAQKRLDEIDRQIKEVEKTIKSEEVSMPNPAYQTMQAGIQERERRLTEMRVNYTDDHPQVKSLMEEIATLKAQLKDTPERVAGNITQAINPQYQALIQARSTALQEVKGLEASLNETEAEIMVNEANIRKVVDQEKQYADIQRQHDEAKDAYEQYHKSLISLMNRQRVENEANSTQVEIIARALEPAAPWRGYRPMIVLGCLGGAAAAGFILMFLLEFVDHSLRGPDDAAASLGVPVLATLTEIPKPERLDPGRARRRLMLFLGITFIMLCIVAATLVEGLSPGKLGDCATYVRRLLH